jgi:hypothetical protein
MAGICDSHNSIHMGFWKSNLAAGEAQIPAAQHFLWSPHCRARMKSALTYKPCGTLADANQTLHTIRGAFGEVEVAAHHENAQLTKLDTQERDLFDDLHGVLGQSRETLASVSGFASAASATMRTVKETVAGAQPVLASLKTTSDSLDGAAQALTTRLDDPHVAALVANLDVTAKDAADATGDVKTVFDRVANPQPCKGRWCFAIKAARIMSAARDVPQFGYWTNEFVQSLRSH